MTATCLMRCSSARRCRSPSRRRGSVSSLLGRAQRRFCGWIIAVGLNWRVSLRFRMNFSPFSVKGTVPTMHRRGPFRASTSYNVRHGLWREADALFLQFHALFVGIVDEYGSQVREQISLTTMSGELQFLECRLVIARKMVGSVEWVLICMRYALWG